MQRPEPTGNRSPAHETAELSGIPPTLIYGALAIFSSLLIAARFPPSSFRIFVLFAVCLALQFTLRVWTGTLILLLIQVSLFMTEDSQNLVSSPLWLQVVVGASVVLLLLASGRFITLSLPVIPRNVAIPVKLRQFWNHFAGTSPLSMDRSRLDTRDARLVTRGELLTGLSRVIVSVLAAQQILLRVPLNPLAETYANLYAMPLRAISIGLGLLAIAILANIVLGALSWRRISPGEASVFLRSQLSQECHREIASVFKQQQRERRRRRE